MCPILIFPPKAASPLGILVYTATPQSQVEAWGAFRPGSAAADTTCPPPDLGVGMGEVLPLVSISHLHNLTLGLLKKGQSFAALTSLTWHLILGVFLCVL